MMNTLIGIGLGILISIVLAAVSIAIDQIIKRQFRKDSGILTYKELRSFFNNNREEK